MEMSVGSLIVPDVSRARSPSREIHSASSSSSWPTRMAVLDAQALNPSINELGKGQGWEDW